MIRIHCANPPHIIPDERQLDIEDQIALVMGLVQPVIDKHERLRREQAEAHRE